MTQVTIVSNQQDLTQALVNNSQTGSLCGRCYKRLKKDEDLQNSLLSLTLGIAMFSLNFLSFVPNPNKDKGKAADDSGLFVIVDVSGSIFLFISAGLLCLSIAKAKKRKAARDEQLLIPQPDSKITEL